MYLYPKWLRLWHVMNALLFIILIVTGVSMQYSNKDADSILIGFARAVKWHNIAAILLTINYMIFVTGNVLSSNGKYYKIEKKHFIRDLAAQLKFYAGGMFHGERHPFPVNEERKFNPLQKLSYVLAMYVGMPLLILSGIGLLFPEITVKNFFGVSGLIYTDILHITIGFILSIFMIVHIYTCTLGSTPTTLFRGMITGYHSAEEDEAAEQEIIK